MIQPTLFKQKHENVSFFLPTVATLLKINVIAALTNLKMNPGKLIFISFFCYERLKTCRHIGGVCNRWKTTLVAKIKKTLRENAFFKFLWFVTLFLFSVTVKVRIPGKII